MKQGSRSHALLAGLVAALFVPAAALAADAELVKKIEALTQQLEELKAQVKANQESSKQATAELKEKMQKTEDRSMEKWLTVGGDYQFRVDRLAGETEPFTDVNATFATAQQTLQVQALTSPEAAQALAGMAQFSQGMAEVQTYEQARAFLGDNQAMLEALSGFAQSKPAYKPRNTTMYSNRFGLDLNARATQDVTVSARLLMYKNFGAGDDDSVTRNGSSAPFFSDRVGVFDGTLGHIPSSDYLNVDRVYATWTNIADQDLWFSVGRRPSTDGTPTNLKLNTPRPGRGGIPSILVNYAFDGMVLGYAPEIDALPGAYAKLCYGRGYESGFRSTLTNSIEDTDMLGISVVPIDTDPLRVWMQWNRGYDIFDAPKMESTYFGNTMPRVNLGDIEWWGMGAMGTVKKLGIGDLHWFADFALSKTRPNSNVSAQFGFQGLLTGSFFNPEAPQNKTGNAIYVGLRYDLPSRTKIGLEYNRGSKNWITFAPAAGDVWTSKVGTRGNVYEAYLIQELNSKPISSLLSKSFVRLGFQYYDFQYTGSNNWVGAPVRLSSVNGDLMTLTPLSSAYNAYATFEVKF